MNKWNITKLLLQQKYLDEKKTMQNIADEIGCPKSTIAWYIRYYNIPTRIGCPPKGVKMPTPKKIDRDILEDLYINEKLTIKQIANRLKSVKGTVFRYLRLYNIPTRRRGLWGSWNKGLTEETDPRVRKYSELQRLTKSTFSYKNKLSLSLGGTGIPYELKPLSYLLHTLPEYKKWRENILVRDNFFL